MTTPAPNIQQANVEEASTAALLREVVDEAKELVRIEVEIAKNEANLELERAKRAVISLAIGLASGALVLCLLAVALILALGGTASMTLAVAGVVVVIGGIATWVGYGSIPTSPLRRTRRLLENDVQQLKEHLG